MVFLISVYMNQVHFLSWLFGILSVLALANLCVVKINRNNQLWSAHAKVLLVWSCFFSCYENSILLLFTDRYAPRARTRDLCEVQWLEQWSKKLLKLRATFLGFSVWRLRAVELKANKRKDKINISEHKLRQVTGKLHRAQILWLLSLKLENYRTPILSSNVRNPITPVWLKQGVGRMRKQDWVRKFGSHTAGNAIKSKC